MFDAVHRGAELDNCSRCFSNELILTILKVENFLPNCDWDEIRIYPEYSEMLANLGRSGLLPGSQVFLGVKIFFSLEILAETQLVQNKRVGLFQL